MDKTEIATAMKSEIKALRNQMDKAKSEVTDLRRLINRRQRALSLYTTDSRENKREEVLLVVAKPVQKEKNI